MPKQEWEKIKDLLGDNIYIAQQEPFTTAVGIVYLEQSCTPIVGVGRAKCMDADPWNEDLGKRIVVKRVCRHILDQLREIQNITPPDPVNLTDVQALSLSAGVRDVLTSQCIPF